MKKLPIVGSSAAQTAFASAPLSAGGITVWFDGNQKIYRDNGTWEAPGPNAFSIANAVDCPQSTPTCRASCYVNELAKAAPDLHALYRQNSAAIREIIATREVADAWAMEFAAWIREHAPGGFRWHVSGDVWSREYASWIADVCRETPEVPHWIYTRSFDLIGPLVEVATVRGGNLALNLSADKDNYHEARVARFAFAPPRALPEEQLRICYLVESSDPGVPEDLPDGSVLFPDYDLRPRGVEDPTKHPFWASLDQRQRRMMCVVDSFGKSESRRCGPCGACLT